MTYKKKDYLVIVFTVGVKGLIKSKALDSSCGLWNMRVYGSSETGSEKLTTFILSLSITRREAAKSAWPFWTMPISPLNWPLDWKKMEFQNILALG